MKKLVLLALVLPLAGCNAPAFLGGGQVNITPAQLAQLNCYLLQDGVTIAGAFAAGGAASTVGKLAGLTPVACVAGANVAAVVTTPAQAKAAVAAGSGGTAAVAAAVAGTAAAGK